jgi:hypothetical protein
MINMGLILGVFFCSSSVFAQSLTGEEFTSKVTDVTAQYAMLESAGIAPTPTPAAKAEPTATPASTTTTPSTTDLPPETTSDTGSGVDIGKIIALGEKIWDFIISNKPTAEYPVFKTSVVPAGITNWAQLKSWAKPISKVYHVEFTNMFGGSAGGFDYRITYFYNGSFNGKGKFLGQISVVPLNVSLHTDRTLKMNVELASVLNFGTETDPVAGAQIIVTWSTPTTTHYEMNSSEYMIYGTGEIQDLSNGN